MMKGGIMKDLNFMQKLCDEKSNSPITASPFRIHDGKGMILTVATEGHGLLAMYQESEYPLLPDDLRAKVMRVIAPTNEYTHHKIDFKKLKTFTGIPDWVIKCEECQGEGFRETCKDCDGAGFYNDDECSVCHGEGKYECIICHGRGSTCGAVRPVMICGIYLDANLLSKYIEHVECDVIDISVGGNTSPVIIQGPDWIVSIMPLHYQGDVPIFEGGI